MAQALPSGTNTYIPQMEDSLVVGYSRNINDFKVNQYCQMVPVSKNQAYYLYVDGAAAVRLTSSDLRNIIWPDGSMRPAGVGEVAEFEFKPVATTRHSFEFTLGKMGVDQAVWDIVGTNSHFTGIKAMTARTMSAITALTSGSWGTSTATAAAASVAGGGSGTYINSGTSTAPTFKAIVNYARRTIREATFGAVQSSDIMCLMQAKTAEILSQSQEIHDYVKSSPFALAALRGDSPNQNMNWGLPPTLYGCPIIVEDAIKVTSKKGATLASSAVLDYQKIYFVSRVGGLVMPQSGGANFSTLQMFMREEMTVEQYPDTKNRIIQGFVTDDYGTYLVATASGFQITSALA